MVGPLITGYDAADLRQQSTAGMIHKARQQVITRTRLPNGEVPEVVGWGPAICCHLKSIGSTLAQIAAASGVEAQWSLKVPLGTRIPAGSLWAVTTDDEEGSVYPVKVTGDLVRIGRTMRLVAAVDTVLNR